MRNDREQWNRRKKKYLRFLCRTPAHRHALTESLKELATPDIYDEIFLHVFAPAVVSYVGWVLDDASRRGIKRLYFLSRDGWLMYQAAKKLAVDMTAPPELRYLKVSRYSLRRAEYLILGKKCLDLICVGGIDITFRKIMLRAALTGEELRHVAGLTGFEDKMDRVLSYRQIMNLKEQLDKIDLFFEYVKKHSQECFETTVGYLRQEGLMEEKAAAIVDSGWIGTTKQSLGNLIHAGRANENRGNDQVANIRNDSPENIRNNNAASIRNDRAGNLDGYYFGIFEIPKGCEPSKYHGFYINYEQGLWQNLARKTKFSICLFETVISSPEGMTLGYKSIKEPIKDRWFPADSDSGNPNRVFMNRNQKLLELYLNHYLQSRGGGDSGIRTLPGDKKIPDWEKECRMLYRILKNAMGKPTVIEAEVLGILKFCDDVLEHRLQYVAANWSRQELKKHRFFNKLLIQLNLRQEILHESGWPEGSFVNAGKPGHIPQEHFYKYLMYLRKRQSISHRT